MKEEEEEDEEGFLRERGRIGWKDSLSILSLSEPYPLQCTGALVSYHIAIGRDSAVSVSSFAHL